MVYAVLSIAKDTFPARSDLTTKTSWKISSRNHPNDHFGIFADAILSYCSQLMFSLSPQTSASPETLLIHDPRIAPDYDKSYFDVCVDFMDYCIGYSVH